MYFVLFCTYTLPTPAGSPEYVFCHELAKVTLSTLSNMARVDAAYAHHVVKAHGLTDLFGATLVKQQVSQQLLNQLCILLRIIFKESAWPDSITVGTPNKSIFPYLTKNIENGR